MQVKKSHLQKKVSIRHPTFFLLIKEENERNPANRNSPIGEQKETNSISIVPQIRDNSRKKKTKKKKKKKEKINRAKMFPPSRKKVAYSKPRVKNMTPKNCFTFIFKKENAYKNK